jgi:signal peptidase
LCSFTLPKIIRQGIKGGKMQIKTKKYKVVKTLGTVFYWLTLFLLVFVSFVVASSALNLTGGYRLLFVKSGSMRPSIPMGSLIFTKPQESYKPGEVITFEEQGTSGNLVTHRISDIEQLEDEKLFITRGDANDANDSARVDEKSVVGKVVWAIPLIGYVVSFAKTTVGLIVLIIIPATLIVYNELSAIKNGIMEIISRKKKAGRRRFGKTFVLRLRGNV